MTAARELLRAEGLVAGFGATTVLHGVTLSVANGDVAGVFGLNGAGKSVTMKVLAGVVPAREGTITFAGTDITSLSAEERVELGMAHVPQGRQVFAALTVEENLRLGAYTLRRRDRGRYRSVLDGIYDRFPVLAERRTQTAGTLSGGQQASLAVARALVAEPKLVLVDEPSAGLAPIVVQQLFETLRSVAQSGMTMVLVEQNVTFGLRVVDTVNVLQAGTVVLRSPVGSLDHDQLTAALGIGRLTRSLVERVIEGRGEPQSPEPVRRRTRTVKKASAAKKSTATTNKTAAKASKKAAATKKRTATKKVAATKKVGATKKATAKKKAAPTKAAARKRGDA